jgi:transcriptional regulator with PAS, ATPase and Fis domain
MQQLKDGKALILQGYPALKKSGEVERNVIANALEIHGSVSKVAEILKVNRMTIFRKMRNQPQDLCTPPKAEA